MFIIIGLITIIKISLALPMVLLTFLAFPAGFTICAIQGQHYPTKMEGAPTIGLFIKLLLWSNPVGWVVIVVSLMAAAILNILINFTQTISNEIEHLSN